VYRPLPPHVACLEDSRIRTGHDPQVMASLRNLVVSILRLRGLTNIAAIQSHSRNPTTGPRPPSFGAPDGLPSPWRKVWFVDAYTGEYAGYTQS
jgi:hypothetical protein